MWRRWVPKEDVAWFGDGCPLNDSGGRRDCCDRENAEGFAVGFVGVEVVTGAAATAVVVVREIGGAGFVLCGAFVVAGAEVGVEVGVGAEDGLGAGIARTGAGAGAGG